MKKINLLYFSPDSRPLKTPASRPFLSRLLSPTLPGSGPLSLCTNQVFKAAAVKALCSYQLHICHLVLMYNNILGHVCFEALVHRCNPFYFLVY